MNWFRRKPAVPPRQPHPDGRIEAELQRVIALQRSVQRTEARIEDIRGAQARVDTDVRMSAGDTYMSTSDLVKQATVLREERRELEERVAAVHDEISRRLTELGDGAVYL